MTGEATAQEKWRRELRSTRKQLGLSQAELARSAGVSVELVRAYENGRRDPTRKHLGEILEALQMDRSWRNQMLMDAGFAPDGLIQRPSNIEDWWLSADEAAAEIVTYAWPSFVLSERGEVLSANAAAQALWSVDLDNEFLEPLARNLLSIASNPRFADRCLNWDEAVMFIAKLFKSYHRKPEDLDEPTPYMRAVLEHFLKGEPAYVARFVTLWQNAEPDRQYKFRFTYPIAWKDPDFGMMSFNCLFSSANEIDGLSINDWIPVDLYSWSVLEQVKAAGRTGGK